MLNSNPDTLASAGIFILEKYFDDMSVIIKEKKTSSRVRFLMQVRNFFCQQQFVLFLSLIDQDVIDLRKANWVTRRKDIGPTTIDQIHQEAKKEELKKKLASMTTDAPPPPRKSEDRRR